MLFALSLAGMASALVPTGGKWFDRIVVIQFENHAEDEVIQDPNFLKYSKMGQTMTNYYAITHPSQPNYWTQVGGDDFGIADDGPHDLNYTNLVDLFEPKNVTWKAYQEDYPGTKCDASVTIGKYYRKHNPFISFDNIRNNPTRCARIVNSAEFDKDLDAKALPQYSYFTPNIDNDAHDTSIAYGGKWLDSFLTPRLSKFESGTLIVITWDEDDHTEGNKILTFLMDPQGSIFKPGTTDNTKYTHYSLLATVEANWDLGDLGRNDKGAQIFKFQTR